jgi:hypothetical protein
MKNIKNHDSDKTSKEKTNIPKIVKTIKEKPVLPIVGGVALVIMVIIWVVCANSNKTDDNDVSDNGKWISACSDGTTDMISGGEWIVGKDIASGNYLVESKNSYAYAYIYKNADVSSYDKTLSLDKSSGYFHFENGQKVEVSSGNIDMTCKNLGELELLSSNKTMLAGSYTLVSANSYFYAYVYEKESDNSYSATISINGVGNTKDFRFKDGQYIEVSSGNAFLIDKNASNYDNLVSEAKKLVNALTTSKIDKKEESEINDMSASDSNTTSNGGSSSSTNDGGSSSGSSSSKDANFRKAMSDYESFMNKYVDFMKKYKNSSDTMSMLADYSKMMQDYAKFADSISKYNQSNLSSEDWAYYIEVTTRVNKKLLEVQ